MNIKNLMGGLLLSAVLVPSGAALAEKSCGCKQSDETCSENKDCKCKGDCECTKCKHKEHGKHDSHSDKKK